MQCIAGHVLAIRGLKDKGVNGTATTPLIDASKFVCFRFYYLAQGNGPTKLDGEKKLFKKYQIFFLY